MISHLLLPIAFGLAFYWFFRKYITYSADHSKESLQNIKADLESMQETELGLYTALVAKVINKNNDIKSAQSHVLNMMLDDMSAVFKDPKETKKVFLEIIEKEKENQDNYLEAATNLGNIIRFKGNISKHEQFIGFLIQLLTIDKELTPEDKVKLEQISIALKYDLRLFETMYSEFEKLQEPQNNTLDDAYNTLKTNKNESFEDIEKAYNELLNKNHLNLVKIQDKTPKYLRKITQKTQDFSRAYETIKTSLNN